MLFAVDLDNTLIYSYKHYHQGVCVEKKDGKALSYMTTEAYMLLQQLKEQLTIVPLTTRSLEQYRRIQLWSAGEAPYALTSNGAILLVDGQPDTSWARETADLIQESLPELEKALALLAQDEAITLEPRFVDAAFVYSKSRAVMQSMEMLAKELDAEKIFLDHNGEKLYVLPKALTKGMALKRLAKRLNCVRTVAAGDSLFDLSMLEAADVAIIPQNSILSGFLGAHRELVISDKPGEHFGEFVLETFARFGLS